MTTSEQDSSAETGTEETASPRRQQRMKRIFLVIGVIVLVALIWWGWGWWTTGRWIESTDDAYVQSDPSVIAPKVGGYVEDVLVNHDQVVKAGDVLVRIDPSDYQVALTQAKAKEQAAEADLGRARAEKDRAVTAVAEAKARLVAAQSKADFAQDQVNRYTPLAKSGAATSEQISQLQSQRDQAVANVNVAQAGVASAQSAVGTATAAVAQAAAEGAEAAAAVHKAELDLDHTVLKAPISGKVGDRTVQKGQLVQPGTRLLTIVPLDHLYITANFKETQIELMRLGQPVTIEVDAISSVTLHGKVIGLSPGTGSAFSLLPAQNATGNFTKIVQRVPVRISIEAGPEAQKILVPGLSVTAEVDTKDARGEGMRLREERAPANAAQTAGQP
ncbi:HlyD family secretion protein [Thioclava sp. BHET1]|nr:HlyD family secretion protein [Thioclava sp. BHET1]